MFDIKKLNSSFLFCLLGERLIIIYYFDFELVSNEGIRLIISNVDNSLFLLLNYNQKAQFG